jgi:hypothetical protein
MAVAGTTSICSPDRVTRPTDSSINACRSTRLEANKQTHHILYYINCLLPSNRSVIEMKAPSLHGHLQCGHNQLRSSFTCSSNTNKSFFALHKKNTQGYICASVLDDDASRVNRIHRTRAAVATSALVYVEPHYCQAVSPRPSNDLLFPHAACGCA